MCLKNILISAAAITISYYYKNLGDTQQKITLRHCFAQLQSTHKSSNSKQIQMQEISPFYIEHC